MYLIPDNVSPLRHSGWQCPQLPSLSDIKLNKKFWQETTNSYGYFYLYGAYLDIRAKDSLSPSVRILAMIEPKNKTIPVKQSQQKWEGIKMYCHIWFSKEEPAIISEA